MNKNTEIIDTITLKNGMEIDLDEAWRKLTQRQFGGSPGRGFGELVQNGYDGYDAEVAWSDRKLDIKTTPNSISITDYGVGMSREKLKLLVTLGGTDKANDKTKIGQFGIGFCSMFNPDLVTERIWVHTICEGHAVELVFNVIEQSKIPKITTGLMTESLPFSTRITAEFDNSYSSETCLEYARECLKTFPCKVKINGCSFKSIWEKARQAGHKIFTSGQCMGFVETSGWYGSHISLLRRYEKITDLSMESLITGGHSMKFDLRDWARKETPYVNDIDITINCNDLNVPISRDGFYMDSAYSRMVRVINEQMMHQLEKNLEYHLDHRLILTNHYVLRNKIANYLDRKIKQEDTSKVEVAVKLLAKAPIYPVNGKSESFSLLDIAEKRSKDLPVFFSPERTNLRWLGGAFKHDFIVLPSRLSNENLQRKAPEFYQTIFTRIFSDVVNLDEVEYDHSKMADLVKRNIIDKGLLSPHIQLTKIRELNKKEKTCVQKIDQVLSHGAVKKAIARNLNLQISNVTAAFFQLETSGGTIATGFLDENGCPLEPEYYTNLGKIEDESWQSDHAKPILLGLQKDNPYIESLINTEDDHMPYYMLMFLVHELAMCQKLLVPYSPYFHVVKARLAKDMRKALIEQLLSAQDRDKKMKTPQ